VKTTLGVMIISLALAGLAGCEKQVRAPRQSGVCFHMVPQGETVKFNDLPGQYRSMEYCAAALERVRLNGGRQQIIGAYQGKFIFAQARGIFVGKSLDGPRYLALLRTRDGKLAPPGAAR
jgi:hypothetical protein